MKRKVFIVLILIITLMSLLTVNVKAALSFTTTMTPGSSSIPAATEVVVTVKVSNLEVGDNGINSFSAYLSYSTDVFEPLTESSIDGANGWSTAYSTGTGKVTLQKTSFVKTDEDIMQISLKTKSGLQDGKQGEVKLSQIVASNSVDEITAKNVSTTITIGQAGATPLNPTPTTPVNNAAPSSNSITIQPTSNTIITPTNTETNTTPTPLPAPVNTNTNTNTNMAPTNTRVIDNRSSEDMPYTGSMESGAISRIIIGVIFISLAIFIKIERMNDIH